MTKKKQNNQALRALTGKLSRGNRYHVAKPKDISKKGRSTQKTTIKQRNSLTTPLPDWLNNILNTSKEIFVVSQMNKRERTEAEISPHVISLTALTKRPSLYLGKQEHYLQVTLFYLMEVHHPDIYKMMFSNPVGGYRSKTTASTMKSEGQKKGYPDISIDIPVANYHGLRLEIKTDEGRPSKEQLEWQKMLRSFGYKSEITKGFESSWSELLQYVGMIKEHWRDL